VKPKESQETASSTALKSFNQVKEQQQQRQHDLQQQQQKILKEDNQQQFIKSSTPPPIAPTVTMPIKVPSPTQSPPQTTQTPAPDLNTRLPGMKKSEYDSLAPLNPQQNPAPIQLQNTNNTMMLNSSTTIKTGEDGSDRSNEKAKLEDIQLAEMNATWMSSMSNGSQFKSNNDGYNQHNR
jgi:hypothetical protein